MLGSEPVRDSRVMKNDSLPSIHSQHASGFPAGRIVSGAPMWQIRVVSGASRDAREVSGLAVPRRLSRKAATGWLAAALLFTGSASPPVHAAATGAAPKMFPG